MKRTLWLLALCLSGLIAIPAWAQMPPERAHFFKQLQSPFLEILTEGDLGFDEEPQDFPFLVRALNSGFWKVSPSGKPSRMSEKCDGPQWKEKYLSQAFPSFAQEAQFLGDRLQACETEWQTGWNSTLANAVGAMSIEMHPKRYPFGRQVMFHLPGQVKLKGFLAMKPDEKPRPLVIFRTGIFSVVHEFFPERYLFMQMFDQSPFHVLVIESLSGSDFIRRNQSYSMGGFDEGIQNFLISEQLQKSEEPISKYLRGVHLMGMSFGGHGVFFASLLSDLNPKDPSVIDSAINFCPLINFRETLDFHSSTGFSLDFMNYYVEKRVGVLKQRIPEFGEGPFVASLFKWIEKNYKGPIMELPPALKGKEQFRLPVSLSSFQKEIPQSEWFWKLNDFWASYQNIKTPVLVVSTENDPIVPWVINSGRLLTGRMPMSGSSIAFLPLQQGVHCSLNVAYDWSALATLNQSFILKHAKNFVLETREMRFPLGEGIDENRIEGLDFKFSAKDGSDHFNLRVRFDKEKFPAFYERWLSKKMDVEIPLGQTEYSAVTHFQTKAEKQILERWAHQNIHGRVEGRELILSWQVTR